MNNEWAYFLQISEKSVLGFRDRPGVFCISVRNELRTLVTGPGGSLTLSRLLSHCGEKILAYCVYHSLVFVKPGCRDGLHYLGVANPGHMLVMREVWPVQL